MCKNVPRKRYTLPVCWLPTASTFRSGKRVPVFSAPENVYLTYNANAPEIDRSSTQKSFATGNRWHSKPRFGDQNLCGLVLRFQTVEGWFWESESWSPFEASGRLLQNLNMASMLPEIEKRKYCRKHLAPEIDCPSTVCDRKKVNCYRITQRVFDRFSAPWDRIYPGREPSSRTTDDYPLAHTFRRPN